MAGFLQRFFDGPSAAAGLALAPAHRPTSPLFTPDQQIAHAGFDSGDGLLESVTGNAVWPDTGFSTSADRKVASEPARSNREQPQREPNGNTRQALPLNPNSNLASVPEPIGAPAILSARPLIRDDQPSPIPAETETEPKSGARPLADAGHVTHAPAQAAPRGSPPEFAAAIAEQPSARALSEPPSEAAPKVRDLRETPQLPPDKAAIPPPAKARPAREQAPHPQLDGVPEPAAPRIRPVERLPEPLPQLAPAEPDWKAIDARIDARIREQAAQQKTAQRDPVSLSGPASESRASASSRPMTAAEASVIGKIGAARRPIMIFGTKLR